MMTYVAAVLLVAAQAPQAVTTLHPIFAALPDLPQGDEAHKAFGSAAKRYGLGPVEVMDVPGPPPARAAALLKVGRAAVEQKKFEEAEAVLDEAAAVLARDRQLLPRQFPPLAIASWRLAVEEINQRPRGSMLVRAATSALISVDGGPLKPGILPAQDLVQGEHWVRVEDPGRQPWAAVIPLTEQSMEVDVPASAALTLDDRMAALHARRQGAAFALVAELKPGRPAAIELRLIESDGATRRDSTTLPFPGEAGALEAAVMRLDEQARRVRLNKPSTTRVPAPALGAISVAPVVREVEDGKYERFRASKPDFGTDPKGWAKARWPLLTAVSGAVVTALVLGLLVARDDGR
jgi:hypothetical protein